MDDQDQQKHICHDCVGEPHLSRAIETGGTETTCHYCEDSTSCISIDELADHIEKAFEDHYQRTSDQPNSWQYSLLADKESTYEWWRDGEPVLDAIQGAADVSEEIAQDVLEILSARHDDFEMATMHEETEFAEDSHYERVGASGHVWHEEWSTFEQSLKTEARFFSRMASDLLARVFGNIDDLQTAGRNRPIVIYGPNSRTKYLFRARVFQSQQDLKIALCRPDLHLGPPPARHANAGRMNARGISVFYGSTKADAAIAEVRPPVGSYTVVARFKIVRPLRLFNLPALVGVTDDGSIFDPAFKERLERIEFLKTLGKRITRPVMPDDEALDYLATQVIADFLAIENTPKLDGIIFNSVQSKKGLNIVLFHHAAMVQEMDIPKDTVIEAYTGWETDEGLEIDYSVTEEIPAEDPEKPQTATENSIDERWPIPFDPRYITSESLNPRDFSLQLDPDSLEVHHVNSVRVETQEYRVSRRRYEKRDWSFARTSPKGEAMDPGDTPF